MAEFAREAAQLAPCRSRQILDMSSSPRFNPTVRKVEITIDRTEAPPQLKTVKAKVSKKLTQSVKVFSKVATPQTSHVSLLYPTLVRKQIATIVSKKRKDIQK